MKNTTALLLIAPITLLAGMVELKSLYDQKKYKAVISKAQQSTSEYDNPKLHLLWAKSAESLGKEEIAMSSYERVLMLDPDNVEVRVHLAIYYSKTGRYELAKEMSKSTENYQLTPAQRMSIQTLGEDELQSFKTSASMSIGYDSNINVSPGDLDLPLYDEEIDTMFTLFTGSLSYTHDLDEKGGWYLRSDADIFYQHNADASYYDLFAGSAGIGLGYRGNSYDAFLPVSYKWINYLDRDFMEVFSVDPRINFTLSDSLIGNINARYAQRSYLHENDKNRDDSITGIGTGLYWFFEKNFTYISANYDNYSAKHSDSLRFTNKDTTRVAMGINYNVEDLFIIRLDYRYRYAKYNDRIEETGEERSDDYNQIECKVSRMLTDTLEASLLYRYSTNNSNYDLVEYDKNIIMLGLQYNF